SSDLMEIENEAPRAGVSQLRMFAAHAEIAHAIAAGALAPLGDAALAAVVQRRRCLAEPERDAALLQTHSQLDVLGLAERHVEPEIGRVVLAPQGDVSG